MDTTIIKIKIHKELNNILNDIVSGINQQTKLHVTKSEFVEQLIMAQLELINNSEIKEGEKEDECIGQY